MTLTFNYNILHTFIKHTYAIVHLDAAHLHPLDGAPNTLLVWHITSLVQCLHPLDAAHIYKLLVWHVCTLLMQHMYTLLMRHPFTHYEWPHSYNEKFNIRLILVVLTTILNQWNTRPLLGLTRPLTRSCSLHPLKMSLLSVPFIS